MNNGFANRQYKLSSLIGPTDIAPGYKKNKFTKIFLQAVAFVRIAVGGRGCVLTR